MTSIHPTIEIMSPVGSYESLMAAIQGGADSVYFGIGQLNMRAHSSNNFSETDLENIVIICQDKGVRTYLTMNTVIYDHELEEMQRIITVAKRCRVDAIIASDLALLEYARTQDLEIHLSTQLNISNFEALRFFAKYADVVVLARELTLEQVEGIANQIRTENLCGPSGSLIRIELFVHGALCMAISGKCYLSLHENNHSANRGKCLQSCRKAYTVTEKESGYQLDIENEYIMSPKDLCTIEFLDKILDAGVSILKIEGRARSPEYVKTVTQVYHQAVRSILAGEYSETLSSAWKAELENVFNRGFWEGYYLGGKLGEWCNRYGSRAKKRKIYLGKVRNYFAKIQVAEFDIETEHIEIGDEILVTGPTTGLYEATVLEIRVDHKDVVMATKGEFCSIPVNVFLRRSDKLYKIVEASQIKQQ